MLVTPVTFRRLCRARDLLLREPAPRVAAVAREVGLSRFHFMRAFSALFGLTPRQFVIRQRLERARALLANGSPVTDTCLEVGFSSLGSFSAQFRRELGEAPSALGRRLGPVLAAHPRALEPGCLSLLAALSEKRAPQPSRYDPEHATQAHQRDG
jgi:AraC-like DNA-binding protein